MRNLLCLALVVSLAGARSASAQGSDWAKTVASSRKLIASDARQQVAFKPMYAARAIVIFDEQLRALNAVERDVAAFKTRNKTRGFFVGVAAPAPMLARIGAARKQVARLRALAPVPVGMFPARRHFLAYCEAMDAYLDAAKAFVSTNDALVFETLQSRALGVARRESLAGIAALRVALRD